jgi:hypothetical protein
MLVKCENIYRLARYMEGLDIMSASIELGIGYRTLQSYELFEVIPNSRVVINMAKIYKADWLKYYHLALNDDIGRLLLERPLLEDIFLHEEKAKSEKASLTRLQVNIHN